MLDARPAIAAPPRTPLDTLEDVLARTDRPLTVAELRHACRVRTATVCQALATLTAQGRIEKTIGGYQRISRPPVSDTPLQPPGNGNG